MTYFMKKIHLAMTLLLMTSLGNAYGDYYNSPTCATIDNSCACNPCCGGKGFISAELLYWRAFENGLDTCFPTDVYDSVTSDGTVISRFSGNSRDPHFEWNPGFRLGTGYEFACSNLGVGVFWTHLDSKAHGSGNRENSVRWNIDFDVVDVIVGYDAAFGSCVNLIPFIGLRGARIDQKLHMDGFSHLSSASASSTSSSSSLSTSSTFSNVSIPNDPISESIHNKQKFSGLGPLLGLEADWKIGCDFSLYANASVSWLYGKFNIKHSETEEFVDALNICEGRKHLDASLLNADAGVGIRWQTCFCSDARLTLQLGLETHRYFDYNRLGCCGDLSFDGVNFGVGFEY